MILIQKNDAESNILNKRINVQLIILVFHYTLILQIGKETVVPDPCPPVVVVPDPCPPVVVEIVVGGASQITPTSSECSQLLIPHPGC